MTLSWLLARAVCSMQFLALDLVSDTTQQAEVLALLSYCLGNPMVEDTEICLPGFLIRFIHWTLLHCFRVIQFHL